MLVLYDRKGVYRIESVGPPPIRGVSGEYYKLTALFSAGNETVYTPVDKDPSMRPLISGEEASRYLELLPALTPSAFHSSRLMDQAAHYRDMLLSRKIEDCLLLIKEIWGQTRKKNRLGQLEAQYLRLAEKLICEEFAVALDAAPEEIRERLYGAMRKSVTA